MTERRAAQRRNAAAEPPERRALTVAGPAVQRDHATSGESAKATASAAFAAQLLGQPDAKRGLKGGPPVLEGARSAYLETEYLGKGERRLPKGVITKQEI
jgi:hypothetical protein